MDDDLRARLDRELERRAKRLRLRWTEVARRADMSVQNLLRIRKGDIAVTDYAAEGIEQALRLPTGSIADFLAGKITTLDAPTGASSPLEDPEYLEWRRQFQELSARYGRDEAIRLLDVDDVAGQNVDKRRRGRDTG